MDPKNPAQNLDPKLQAAYDKVMGISLDGNANPTSGVTPPIPTPSLNTSPAPSTTSPFTTPAAVPPPPTPAATNASTTPTTPGIIPPTPSIVPPPAGQSIPSPATTNSPLSSATPTVQATVSATIATPTPMPLKHSEETVRLGTLKPGQKAAKKGGLSPVIIIFGALVLLAVYAMFWIRFFNYKLPFLS